MRSVPIQADLQAISLVAHFPVTHFQQSSWPKKPTSVRNSLVIVARRQSPDIGDSRPANTMKPAWPIAICPKRAGNAEQYKARWRTWRHVKDNFSPVYIVPRKSKQVETSRDCSRTRTSFTATDEDPGREAISAPLPGAQAQGAGPPAGVSRDHEGSHSRGARPSARNRRSARAGAGDAPDHRPPVWLRGFAPVVAQGAAETLRGPRPERRGSFDRRARARPHGLRLGHLLGSFGHLCPFNGRDLSGDVDLRHGKRIATGRDSTGHRNAKALRFSC